MYQKQHYNHVTLIMTVCEGKRPIYKSVQVFSPVGKTTRKSSTKNLMFGQEKKTSEKESHDNLDQLLNIDNLPKSGLHVKVVPKTSSGKVTPCHDRTKCLVQQICDQNLHVAANTIVKHSEV